MEKSDLDFLSHLLPGLVPIREILSLSHIGATPWTVTPWTPWTLYHSMDCNLPDSLVHGIFQARTLEKVAISYSRGLPNPGI